MQAAAAHSPNLQKARDVFVKTLALNLVVALAKLFWGFRTGALSMIADGFHSLLDASSNIVGIIALNFSLAPPDQDHPYGHRKFEALGAMVISFFLFATSFQILKEAVQRIFLNAGETPIATWESYAIMLGTMAVNYGVSRYETRKGKELNSQLLLADAQHTHSDILTSFSVLISLVAIQLHFPLMDIIAAGFIVLFILRAGYQIIMTHLDILVDGAVLDPKEVEGWVLGVSGVVSCHKIRSRGMPDHIFVDLHVQVDPSLTIAQAHEISYAVEARLQEASGGRIAEVLVHLEDAEQAPLL